MKFVDYNEEDLSAAQAVIRNVGPSAMLQNALWNQHIYAMQQRKNQADAARALARKVDSRTRAEGWDIARTKAVLDLQYSRKPAEGARTRAETFRVFRDQAQRDAEQAAAAEAAASNTASVEGGKALTHEYRARLEAKKLGMDWKEAQAYMDALTNDRQEACAWARRRNGAPALR